MWLIHMSSSKIVAQNVQVKSFHRRKSMKSNTTTRSGELHRETINGLKAITIGLLKIFHGQSSYVPGELQSYELHIDELGNVVLLKRPQLLYVFFGQNQIVVLGLRVQVGYDGDELVRVQHNGRILHGQDKIVSQTATGRRGHGGRRGSRSAPASRPYPLGLWTGVLLIQRVQAEKRLP
jgi:hypothetical protein